MSELVDSTRMDKSTLSVVSLGDEPSDMAYWQTKTPMERLEALELMRAIHYGYDPATARLQRVFEVAELGES